jgi:hypothetical protein
MRNEGPGSRLRSELAIINARFIVHFNFIEKCKKKLNGKNHFELLPNNLKVDPFTAMYL